MAAGAVLWTAAQASAVPVLVDEEKGIKFNVGALIQPQLQIAMPMGENELTAGAGYNYAPDGKSPNFDFYLRRARIMAFGNITKELSFFIDLDNPNFGKNGDYSASAYVQDAFISYAFIPEFKIDAGMMLLPLSHHTVEGAGGLHALDYHAALVRFATSKVFRDTGVQFRGTLLNDKLTYRVGIFEGVRNPPPPAMPPAMPVEPLNEKGMPRVTAMVRFNPMGAENDFFLKGIYFSPTPIVSIGVGADIQSDAVYGTDGQPKMYNAISADAFAEFPFSADDELIAKANFFMYGEGAATAAAAAGATAYKALYAEVGFRHGFIEPLAFVDYLAADNDSVKTLAPHLGVNFYHDKHTFNTKLDLGYYMHDRKVTDATTMMSVTNSFADLVVTAQTQVSF